MTTPTPNACADIHATLSTYLDGELEDADLREFEVHINDCESCLQTLELAERSHVALRAHLADPPKASELLMARITRSLDEEDQRRQQVQRRRWLALSFPTMASALAAAALVLFIWSDLNPTTTTTTTTTTALITEEAARHHLQEQPLFVSGDRGTVTQGAASFLNTSVQAPRFSSPEVRLLGWTPAQLGGKQSAAFVYEVLDQTGRHVVKVHAVKRSEVDVSGQQRLVLHGAELWVDAAYGFNTVTYIGSASVAYVFTSDINPRELVGLVTETDIVNVLSGQPAR
jgi:anti-sigma factor RsiW